MLDSDLARRELLRRAGVGVVAPALVTTEWPSQQGPGGLDVTVRQVARPEFPEIDVYATAEASDGTPIEQLTGSNFDVSEDGTTQRIVSVAADDSLEPDRAGVSVSLVIDRSGSMERPPQKIADARRAATQFVEQLSPTDDAQVVVFDDTVDIRHRWTNDTTVLTDAISAIQADGGTRLWDATITGVEETVSRVERTAVIVLTDGKDTDSTSTLQDAIDAAQTSGVSVYTIGLGSDPEGNLLERLASETGGAYYEAPSSADLTDIYDRISRSLASEYRVTYRTSNTATDGTTRNVRLTATDGGASDSGTGSYTAPCAPLPNAAFDYSPSNPAPGATISFDAAPSSPNGGRIIAYEWDFDNDGTVDATGSTASHSYPTADSYEARLTVRKGCGVTDTTVVSITVGRASSERSVMITANQPTEYALTVDGELSADTVGGDFSCDSDDRVVQNGDGTLTVSDETGPAPSIASPTTFVGDRVRFRGTVTDFSVSQSDRTATVNIYLDEQQVSRSAVRNAAPGQFHTLMITGNAPVEYTVTVDGDLEIQSEAGDFAAEDDDTPTRNADGTMTARGESGPAPTSVGPGVYLGDRYLFTGSVQSLDTTSASGGDVNVYVDEALSNRGTSSGGSAQQPSEETHTLMLTGNGPVDYSLSGDGDLQPQTLAGDFSADDDDTPTRNDDGTLTVGNLTGPAPSSAGPRTFLGDRYRLSGTVTDFQVRPSDPSTQTNVYLDEAVVPPSSVRALSDSSTHTLMVTANGPVEYTLTVDGELQPATVAGNFASEDDDTPSVSGTSWSISGQTGAAPRNAGPTTYLGDRFLVTGAVTDITVTPRSGATANIYLDEEQATTSDVLEIGSP